MINIRKKSIRIFEFFMPVYFFCTVFANAISFYFTSNINNYLRLLVSWGITFIFNIIAGIVFWSLLHEYKKKKLILISIPFVINMLLLLIAAIHSAFEPYTIKELIVFY